jgi:hypothetical protein
MLPVFRCAAEAPLEAGKKRKHPEDGDDSGSALLSVYLEGRRMGIITCV